MKESRKETSSKPRILLAKEYTQEKIHSFFGDAFRVDSFDFIEAHMIPLSQVQAKIPSQATHFILSSRRATDHIKELPLKGCFFCVGSTSAQLLEAKKEIYVFPTAEALLAGVKHRVDATSSVVYFCSRSRRPEIPEGFRRLTCSLTEIETYFLSSKKVKLSSAYDAYAFFSPSGVASFFQHYTIPEKARIFALGKTTKQALEKHIARSIGLPSLPQFDALAKQIKQEFYAKE